MGELLAGLGSGAMLVLGGIAVLACLALGIMAILVPWYIACIRQDVRAMRATVEQIQAGLQPQDTAVITVRPRLTNGTSGAWTCGKCGQTVFSPVATPGARLRCPQCGAMNIFP